MIGSKGIAKIVEAWEVESYTLQGYTLLGMYQETHGDTVMCSVPDPKQDYSGQTINVDEIVQNTTTKFVMVLDEESSLGALNSSIETQKEEIKKLKESNDQNEKALKVQTEGVAHTKKLWEECKVTLDREMKKNTELTTIKRKMEEDIGKIQEAIGSQQMEKILNG